MRIRRVLALVMALALCVTLCACQKKQELTQAETEEVAADYGNAIVLAKDALEETFAEVKGFQVDQCYTAVLTDRDFHIAVSFTFTYDGGEGEYGFECEKVDGEGKIVRQGRDISVQGLLGAQ